MKTESTGFDAFEAPADEPTKVDRRRPENERLRAQIDRVDAHFDRLEAALDRSDLAFARVAGLNPDGAGAL